MASLLPYRFCAKAKKSTSKSQPLASSSSTNARNVAGSASTLLQLPWQMPPLGQKDGQSLKAPEHWKRGTSASKPVGTPESRHGNSVVSRSEQMAEISCKGVQAEGLPFSYTPRNLPRLGEESQCSRMPRREAISEATCIAEHWTRFWAYCSNFANFFVLSSLGCSLSMDANRPLATTTASRQATGQA